MPGNQIAADTAVRHLDGRNFLLLDGHVEWISLEDACAEDVVEWGEMDIRSGPFSWGNF